MSSTAFSVLSLASDPYEFFINNNYILKLYDLTKYSRLIAEAGAFNCQEGLVVILPPQSQRR